MNDQKIRTLVLTALMTALCAVMTTVIKIPSPMGGYFNLGDCAVLLSAWLLGPSWGRPRRAWDPRCPICRAFPSMRRPRWSLRR